MSLTSTSDENEPDGAAENRADVIKEKLPTPEKRARRASAAKPKVVQATDAKKPFSMSYDGVTQADYITYMITRGAR
jgi:hypothetical protein